MRKHYLAVLIGVIVALSAVSIIVSGQQQVWQPGYCDNVYSSGYVCPAGQTLDTKALRCVTPKVECPAGQVLNSATGKCEDEPRGVIDECDPAEGGDLCAKGCPAVTDCTGVRCGNYNKCGTPCGKVCDAGCPSVNTPVCGNPCAPGGAYATTPGKCGNPCNYGTTLVNGECVPVTWCSDGVTSIPPAARCPAKCADGSFAASYAECPDTTGCNNDGCCLCNYYIGNANECYDICHPSPPTETCPDGYGSDCGQCGLDVCSVVSGSSTPPPAGDPCGGDPSCGDPCVWGGCYYG